MKLCGNFAMGVALTNYVQNSTILSPTLWVLQRKYRADNKHGAANKPK